MDYHGQRYLTLSQFQSRCGDLKINMTFRESELEFYERNRLMYPVARTVEPEGVARARHEAELRNDYNASIEIPDDWSRLEQPASSTGEHRFDSELGRNAFLESPASASFVPWDQRWIWTEYQGHPLKFDRTTTYYSWWQVHQIHMLRVHHVFERANLMPHLREDSWLRESYDVPKSPDVYANFRGLAGPYDLLSGYLSRESALRMKHGGWGEIPDITAYRRDRDAAAADVATRGLDSSAVTQFLVDLQDLKERYEGQEHRSLAHDVERDMVAVTEFADIGLGLPWEQLLVQIGIERGEFNKRRIALLDPLEIIRRDAVHSLGYLRTLYEKEVMDGAPAPFLANFADDLVAFCDSNDVFEVTASLDNYSFSDEDLRQDQFPGFLFRRVRSLGLALEQIAKVVLEKSPGGLPSRLTLTPAIESLGTKSGAAWLGYFRTHRSLTRESTTASFQQQVTAIRSFRSPTDSLAERIAQTMLLACLARNATVHTPRVWGDRTEREALGALASACGLAIIEVWWTGRQQGWI